VTMRALNRDECHEPPLSAGHCQDEAQCDINLGLSPLLEHYRILLYARRDINALIVRASRQRPNSFRGMKHEARIPKRMMSFSCYHS